VTVARRKQDSFSKHLFVVWGQKSISQVKTKVDDCIFWIEVNKWNRRCEHINNSGSTTVLADCWIRKRPNVGNMDVLPVGLSLELQFTLSLKASLPVCHSKEMLLARKLKVRIQTVSVQFFWHCLVAIIVSNIKSGDCHWKLAFKWLVKSSTILWWKYPCLKDIIGR